MAARTPTVQPPRKSRASTPKADKVFIADVAARHVAREAGYIHFKDCLKKIHDEYPEIHGNMKSNGFAYWVKTATTAAAKAAAEARKLSSAAGSTPFSPVVVNATGKRPALESPAVHSPAVHNLAGSPSTPTAARRSDDQMEGVIASFAASLDDMEISPRKEPEEAEPTLAERNRAARGGATTTLARQRAKEVKAFKVAALNVAAVRWFENRGLKQNGTEYTPLAEICKQAGKELGCDAPTEQAVSLRVGRHIKGTAPLETTGHTAPLLHEIEPLIVNMVLEYAAYGVVFTGMELRLTVATLISGQPLGDKYARYAARCRGTVDTDGRVDISAEDYIPGTTWLKKFLNRHKDQLKTGYPNQKDILRENWRTADKFEFWYRALEIKLLKYGFCSINPLYKDEDPDAPETIRRVYPDDAPRLLWKPNAADLVVVLDEVGTNMSMIGQNDRGRAEIRIIPTAKAGGGYDYEQAVPKSDMHVTCIDPVTLSGIRLPGICIIARPGIGEDASIYANAGIQTGYWPHGPTTEDQFPGLKKVMVFGKEFEGKVYQSAKGGITPEILADALEHVWSPCLATKLAETEGIDKIIFLVDGHDSRLAKKVLDKCVDLNIVLLIGVCNATDVWQIHDILLNSYFKMLFTRAKRWLFSFKKASDRYRAPEKKALVPTDLVILLNMTTPLAFGNVEKNKKGGAMCGIYPFTKKLLADERVKNTTAESLEGKKRAREASAELVNSELNLGEMDKLDALAAAHKVAQSKLLMGMTPPKGVLPGEDIVLTD